MVEWFDVLIHQVGPLAYLLLCLAALLEYVFPPFPGDTIVLLGGIYAVRGQKPWGTVFLAITLGSVLGSAIDYGAGRLLARRLEHHPNDPWLGISPERIREVQAKMQRRGDFLLLINRFLPGVRALIFVAAGASKLPVGRTLVLGALSSAGWNALLMSLGIAVGGNAERLEYWVRQYYVLFYVVCAVAVAAALLRARLRRSKAT